MPQEGGAAGGEFHFVGNSWRVIHLGLLGGSY
jgi:hypothetical protein